MKTKGKISRTKKKVKTTKSSKKRSSRNAFPVLLGFGAPISLEKMFNASDKCDCDDC